MSAAADSVEKQHGDHHEDVKHASKLSKDEESHSSASIDPEFERKTVKKVDFRLIPILALCYALSLIDRVNVSNAYVSGMAVDLHLLTGPYYSIATLMFFVPYIILELPANIIVRKVGVARWMGSIIVLWGFVTIGMAYSKTWQQLTACRALLGILEAGFFPAAAYLISTWYVRAEIQKRMTSFYMFSVLVGGFSSAIAGGINELAGRRGLGGWQWIFIIEGAVTVFVGILAFIFIVDFPERSKFLTTEEKACVIDRLERDRHDVEYDHWTMQKFVSYVKEPKLWGFALLFGCSTTTTYAFAYFLPIILKSMGYSTLDSQLLVAPPYAASVVIALSLAVVSDKWNIRAPIIMFQAIMTIVGLSLVAFHTNNGVRYFGVFLGLAGGNANVPCVLGYQQNNVTGHTKRAFTTALVVGFGGIGGIVASTVFRSQDAPKYRPGLWVAIGGNLLIVIICIIMSAWFTYRNRQVRAGRGKLIEGREGFYYTI